MSEVRLRFAPAPTGRLHVGNARTALFNWLLARRHAGRFVLRIEDTDCQRCSIGSEQSIAADLAWLGLDWDEGPDKGGPHGPYRQSERQAGYRAAIERLLAGGAAYRCFCSREELAEEAARQRRQGRPPGYGGACRHLPAAECDSRAAAGRPFVVRFRVPPGRLEYCDLVVGGTCVEAGHLADFVLQRDDGTATYNLAVVVDDAAMRISHVLRGADHITNTFKQLLLYQALELTPPLFGHLPLVLGPDREPLSKRHGGSTVADLRAAGHLPEAVRHHLALLGWSPPETDAPLAAADLAAAFRPETIAHAPAVFDPARLRSLGARHLRALAPADLAARMLPWLEQAGLLPRPLPPALPAVLELAAPLAAERMSTLADAPGGLAGLLFFEPLSDPDREAVVGLAADPDLDGLLAAAAEELAGEKPLAAALASLTARTGCRGQRLFRPLRLALTGRLAGPDLDRLVDFIRAAHRLLPELVPDLPARLAATRGALAGR